MSEKEFRLSIFLMMRESGTRILGTLAEKGIAVSTLLTSGKVYDDFAEGDFSHVLVIRISHSDWGKSSRNDLAKQIRQILKDIEVPYYGFLLRDSTGSAAYDGGYMPPAQQAIIDNGPYRTNVVPFPAK